MHTLSFAIAVGIGATALTDLWSYVRKFLLGLPLPNYALVGRWVAHMRHGRFHHDAIAKATPVRGELLLGWSVHYATGIVFATLLLAVGGEAWMRNPSPGLALTIGIVTVAAPFLLLHPGMGLGLAASRTPNPAAARLQSLLTHGVFGVGLYATAWALRQLLN